MKYFVASCFLFIVCRSNAQTVSPDTISYKTGFMSIYPRIMLGDKKIDRQEQVTLFSKVPESYTFYQKYNKAYKVSVYTLFAHFAGLGMMTAGIAGQNKSLASTGLIVSLTTFIISISFKSSGKKDLQHAEDAYNKHVLSY
ncbi:MAG: hypothetical protein HOP10_14270 [Chitinophagaceae bacterium]|nr:hypothetical protein [Chitinophagaceae bacterium]